MPKLDHLPLDLLFTLFNNYFTLQELIQLRAISQTVRQIIESAHCLGKRRTLKIFFSFTAVCQYSNDLYLFNLEDDQQLRLWSAGPNNDDLILKVENLYPHVVDLLVQLLPSVRHLVVYLREYKLDVTVFTLFQHITVHILGQLFGAIPHLTRLSLFGEIDNCLPYQIVELINHKLNGLKRLDWCLKDNFIRIPLGVQHIEGSSVQICPKVLNNLEQFDFQDQGTRFEHHFFHHLSPEIKKLYLDELSFGKGEFFKQFANLDIRKITHLKISQDFDQLEEMLTSSLKSLYLVDTFEEGILEELFPQLQQKCPNLVELKLSCFGFDFVESLEKPKIRPLRSITGLVLQCEEKYQPNGRYSVDQFVGSIGFVFPNLERFEMKILDGDDFLNGPITEQKLESTWPDKLNLFRISYCWDGDTVRHLLSEHYIKRYCAEHPLENDFDVRNKCLRRHKGTGQWINA